jgi:drug/metabolite transporter (DMT)-like permease
VQGIAAEDVAAADVVLAERRPVVAETASLPPNLDIVAMVPHPHTRRVCLAFLALALLAGPIDQFVGPWFLLGSPLPQFASLAPASLLAGLVLLVIQFIRKQRVPSRPQWGACLLLIAPQWCLVPFSSGPGSLPWLHGIGWGTALLISMAAPLWLALADALNLPRAEVPRSVVAAAILGIGAISLVLPAQALSLSWNQAPALVINVLLGVAIAVSWVLARPRLEHCPTASAAGAYLLLSAAGYTVFAFAPTHRSFTLLGWAPLPLLTEVAVFAASWWLWFWLLQKLTLGAFAMRTLATCTAALLPGFFIFGFRQWRMDAALTIACIALIAALRTGPSEEQPVSLGLADS